MGKNTHKRNKKDSRTKSFARLLKKKIVYNSKYQMIAQI